MEYTFCKKCETGNPSYLAVCQNCNSNLFGIDDDSADNIAEGNINRLTEEDEKIADKSLGTKALIFSVFTTTFKVWFLYALTSEAHQSFLQTGVFSAILFPIISAVIASTKYKKWYWILILDSLIMTFIFFASLFFLVYGMMSK